MSRCGCDSGCQCVVEAGANAVVTGTGSLENPYVVSVPGGGTGGTGPTGPTGATGPAGSAVGAQDQTFSYAGALVSATTSPPVRLRFSQTATLVAVTLGTAGSTSTVLDLLKNGVSVDTITIAASATTHDEVIAIAYAADTDILELTVTTAGTGAADMTATVRFT